MRVKPYLVATWQTCRQRIEDWVPARVTCRHENGAGEIRHRDRSEGLRIIPILPPTPCPCRSLPRLNSPFLGALWDGAYPLHPPYSRQAPTDLATAAIFVKDDRSSELQRATRDVELSRAHYRELYERAPVAYLTLDRSGKLLDANPTAALLLRQDRSTLIDRPFKDFVAPQGRKAWIRELRKVFEDPEPRTFEIGVVRTDGDVVAGRAHAVSGGDGNGAAIARMVLTDVTEQKKVEREREQMEQRLSQLSKADSLGRMAGALAHRFNNLLAVTTGNLQLALEDLPAGSEATDAVSDALDAAWSAAEVAGMLLTYLGQDQGEQAPHDLSDLCRRILPMLRGALPPKIQLEDRLPDQGPTVIASVAQIQRVLAQLVNNACEAMGEDGGTIRLVVDTVPPRAIPIRSRFPVSWTPGEALHARISIEDEGPGIPDDVMDRIFDPFFSTKLLGRGMGLSLALGAIRAHQGAMAARNGEWGGTTVEVYLPACRTPTGTREEPEVRSVSGNGKGRAAVLLVEDEPLLRRTGIKLLTRLGHEVIPAADGVEAVELFQANRSRISWVLCDLMMPRMNGWETMANLRALDPEIPIVLTSGFNETHAVDGETQQRPHAFLPKPWSLEGLSSVVPPS